MLEYVGVTWDLHQWCSHSFQIHSNIPTLPSASMMSISSPWPFLQWRIDIIGPFSEAPGKVKLLIVAIDYFTKLVEAELVDVMKKIVKFMRRQIICLFGLPHTIISDNGE